MKKIYTLIKLQITCRLINSRYLYLCINIFDLQFVVLKLFYIKSK